MHDQVGQELHRLPRVIVGVRAPEQIDLDMDGASGRADGIVLEVCHDLDEAVGAGDAAESLVEVRCGRLARRDRPELAGQECGLALAGSDVLGPDHLEQVEVGPGNQEGLVAQHPHDPPVSGSLVDEPIGRVGCPGEGFQGVAQPPDLRVHLPGRGVSVASRPGGRLDSHRDREIADVD